MGRGGRSILGGFIVTERICLSVKTYSDSYGLTLSSHKSTYVSAQSAEFSRSMNRNRLRFLPLNSASGDECALIHTNARIIAVLRKPTMTSLVVNECFRSMDCISCFVKENAMQRNACDESRVSNTRDIRKHWKARFIGRYSAPNLDSGDATLRSTDARVASEPDLSRNVV